MLVHETDTSTAPLIEEDYDMATMFREALADHLDSHATWRSITLFQSDGMRQLTQITDSAGNKTTNTS